MTSSTKKKKSAAKTNEKEGRITQIIGPVIDAAFSPGQMPNIYNGAARS